MRPQERGDVGIAPYGWEGGMRESPNSGPAKRAGFGEEEQRNEREVGSAGNRREGYGACDDEGISPYGCGGPRYTVENRDNF